ncbi:unnamed protein product [Boreogadus saida]
MDFWENIPSRKEQEAVLGRTRRAVSSRPELEDALPEWARGTGLFACLRWSALRSCLWRSALCSCQRWPALQTIQGRHALRSCLRGPAPCSFQRGTGLCSCRTGPAPCSFQGRHALRSFHQRGPALYLAFHQRGPALDLAFHQRGPALHHAFHQRGPALYLSFHQRGPALYLSFHQRGPALYLSFHQRGPALYLSFLLRGPALYLAFAGLLKGSAFPLPLLAPQAVRLRLPAMPWGSFLAARLTSLRSAPVHFFFFLIPSSWLPSTHPSWV